MNKILFHFIAACLAVLPLTAQDAEAEKPRKAKGRIAYFMYTSMPDGVENPVQIASGKDITELTLSKRATSEAVKIPADGILRIVRKKADPADPTKFIYATLAQATIPESVSKALVVLIPLAKPQNDLVFQAKVLDLANFKGGDYMYFNMTNINVGIELGEDKIALKPGEMKSIVAKNITKPTNMASRYNFFHPEEKEWKMISASTVVVQTTRREICIFSWDDQYDRIDYHGITFPVEREQQQ